MKLVPNGKEYLRLLESLQAVSLVAEQAAETIQPQLDAIAKKLDKVIDSMIEQATAAIATNRIAGQPYSKTVFRGVRPKFASTPLSTEGSTHYPGRFHTAGTPTLYFGESYDLIQKETLGSLAPKIVFPAKVKLERVFTLTTSSEYIIALIDKRSLLEPWKVVAKILEIECYSQRLARLLRMMGFEAIRVASTHAPDAKKHFNLIVFPDNLRKKSSIEIIDDGKSLSVPIEKGCQKITGEL